MTINVHNSTKQPVVSSTIQVEDWLNKIKNGDSNLQQITTAREHGKGTKAYFDIKTLDLPAVTFNYLFDGYLKKDNAVESTGVFYIDIDAENYEQATAIKENLKQNKYIYACWISLSTFGVGALVKSSVITPYSFKQVHQLFCQQHQIEFDPRAVKLTQYNVLSYDPDTYINSGSTQFNPLIKEEKRTLKQKVQSVANRKKKKHIGRDCTFLRYNNLNDYWIEGDVVTSEVGFDAVELFLPDTIKEGNRKHTLLAFANNLVWLNPDASAQQVFNVLRSKNKSKCEYPLDNNELYEIVCSIFKYKEEGTLEPQRIRKRKIIFGPNSGMDKQEKREFVNRTIGDWKRAKTEAEIYAVIEGWDFEEQGKITAKKVSKVCGKSLRTVKTYWAEFKSYVKELNSQINVLTIEPGGNESEWMQKAKKVLNFKSGKCDERLFLWSSMVA